MRDNGSVRGWRHRITRGLIGVALFLALAANLGLQVHTSHHGVVVDQAGATMLSIAGHAEPDRSLHLDDLAGTRFLTCPGCQAQFQIGGGHLLALSDLDRPAVAKLTAERSAENAISNSVTGISPRAPPSC